MARYELKFNNKFGYSYFFDNEEMKSLEIEDALKTLKESDKK